MKKLKLGLALFFAFNILLTACGDDDATPPGTDAGSGKVTANIAGQDWESKDDISGATYSASMGTHIIQGFAEDGSAILMTILTDPNSGTIETSGGLFQVQYKPDFLGSDSFMAVGSIGSGMITFTTFNDNKVKGTFEFTGMKPNPDGTFQPLAITNGTFEFDI